MHESVEMLLCGLAKRTRSLRLVQRVYQSWPKQQQMVENVEMIHLITTLGNSTTKILDRYILLYYDCMPPSDFGDVRRFEWYFQVFNDVYFHI